MTNSLHPSRAPQNASARTEDSLLFQPYVELLHFFLARRATVVDNIERLLNCQKKPTEYQQDFSLLTQQFKDCFFNLPDIARDQVPLRDQLEYAHWAAGFKPRANPGNDIIDPAALLVRAFHFWRQTRWPGQKGRVRYAHTLFNVYLLRCITLLNLRLWDEGTEGASARLAQVQGLLDALWRSSPADQPVLARDVRWLFPVAMSPTTDDLRGYLEVMRLIDETLPDEDSVEIHKASVQTGGGHLRSQLRHLSVQRGVPLDDHALVLLTRRSNTLDIALLMQGLVSLLRAYQRALKNGDAQHRLALARAIREGMSPDPELFLNRLDLLGPYSMIEHLFITTDSEGHASYTPMGRRHLQLFEEYRSLIAALAASLRDDCREQRAGAGTYSPYGLLYGFSSNLLELMAFKTLQLEAEARFSLEDAFTAGAEDKRAWVNQWRDLPHISRDVVSQFEYPQQFVEDVQTRIEQALQSRAGSETASTALSTGRFHLLTAADSRTREQLAQVTELPIRYVLSADPQLVAAGKAEAMDQQDLLYCRLEGEFLVSYQTANGWVGISKDVLTEMLGVGTDVLLVGMPAAAGEVLSLMGAGVVIIRH